jgi:hypothetical protein
LLGCSSSSSFGYLIGLKVLRNRAEVGAPRDFAVVAIARQGVHMGDVETALGEAKAIAHEVREGLKDKKFEINDEPPVSTEGECPEECRTRHKVYTWLAHESVDLILRFHWSELYLGVYWEYDGCNVENAYIFVSTKSYIRWLADSDSYTIKVRGEVTSEVSDSTGCAQCCKYAKCVVFHIDVTFNADWGTVTSVGHFIVTVCGEGNDPKVEEV